MEKSPDAFRTISEVAEELNVPQHVLRFWETRFAQIKPMKRAGGRRYYRPADVDLVKGIRVLLYGEGYTIRGVQRILKEEGTPYLVSIGRGEVKPRSGEERLEGAPPPGAAKVAPRLSRAGVAAAKAMVPPAVDAAALATAKAPPPPGRAPLARPLTEVPSAANRMTASQSDALHAALKDLSDARKLLDPSTR